MILTSIDSNEYAQVHANEQKRFIQVTWLQQSPSEVFRQVQTKALAHALEHELTTWLCDMQEMAYLEMADQNWLVREIFTSFDPKHQHVFAYVINSAGFELMSSFRIHDLVKHHPELHQRLRVDIFLSKDLAQQWLTAVSDVHLY